MTNLWISVRYLLSGRTRVCHVLNQAASISYDSLTISLVIAFVSAAVIAIQVSKQFLMSGAEAYIGGSIAIVMIREIAPGFVALAIGARAGPRTKSGSRGGRPATAGSAWTTVFSARCREAWAKSRKSTKTA